jgi:hypothetical protein
MRSSGKSSKRYGLQFNALPKLTISLPSSPKTGN